VTPGADAREVILGALARLDPKLARLADPDHPATAEALAEALAERAQAAERGLILLIDKIEELATLGRGEGQAWTIDLLVYLDHRTLPGVRVLAPARRDLLVPLLALGPLGDTLVRGSLLGAPMGEAAWGDVIDQALSAYGYTLEDEELRRELIAELSA